MRSLSLVLLGLVPSSVSAIECGISLGYDRGINAYYYSGNGSLADFDACSKTCQVDYKCQSFAFGNNACFLYAAPLDVDFRAQSSSPYLFFDRDCSEAVSSFATALPTTTAAPAPPTAPPPDAATSKPPPPTTPTPPPSSHTSPSPGAAALPSSSAPGASVGDAPASGADSAPPTTATHSLTGPAVVPSRSGAAPPTTGRSAAPSAQTSGVQVGGAGGRAAVPRWWWLGGAVGLGALAGVGM